MPWYTYSAIYLIVWSALLVHCLFRREFYPIFGRGWGTKVLWLLTFVFLNPFLTLIYFVFGFLLGTPLNPPKPRTNETGENPQHHKASSVRSPEDSGGKFTAEPAENAESLMKFFSRRARRSLRIFPAGLGPAIAIALIGIVFVFFEMPSSQSKYSEPIVLSKESVGLSSPQGVHRTANQNEPTGGKLFSSRVEGSRIVNGTPFRKIITKWEPGHKSILAHIGTINVNNNVQTLSTASAESGAIVSLRNIMIICQSPNDLLDRSMRKLQKSLVQLPYVGQVSYYPYGTRPEPGGLLADVFMIVDMPVVNEKSFIRSRYLKAIINLTVGSSIFAGTSHSDQSGVLEGDPISQKYGEMGTQVVRFDIESRLEHESKMFGIESAQAKYELAANGISSELIGSVSKQFENLLDKYCRMPKSSRMLCGTYHEPPDLPFLKTGNVQQLISGYGLLKNNHTVWRFSDKRDVNTALMAYRDELKTLGWGQDDLGEDYLRMQKENEHIYIFRQRQRDTKAGTIFWNEPEKMDSETTLIADYESDFTDNQVQKAMDALLDSDVDIKTLLVFEKYFCTPAQLERLKSIIEQSTVFTLDEYLMLARYWVDRGQIDKGRVALLRARAMQRTEKSHNIRTKEIKSLAKKLGAGSLAEGPVAEEIFQQIGFINIERLKEPIETEKSVNEPVLFYRRLNDGELQTFALRVVRSHGSSGLVHYNLLTVENLNGSVSSSENSGKIMPDGTWEGETSIEASAGESKSIRVQVKYLDDENFLFNVIPHHDML
jgi:hypothetical protein